MKKTLLAIIFFSVASVAFAWGQAYLQSCNYGYNSDYGEGGYTGIYKHSSGNTYSYFFLSSEYSWCPQTIDF